ncbi:ATP-binding protein [Kutzneria sp. NPDC052558]|uniref:ATP-binding protein n=1 Tax=Kutzneria sp. NPDC052558 TaxID=3364121 RepID=UPI0037CC4D94
MTQSVSGSVVQAGAIHGDVHLHAPAPCQSVPRQLPPCPSHFTNRSQELRSLDHLMAGDPDRSTPVLAVITGSGGVGKTALALRWLHSVSESFPDGQLYVDLSAFGAGGPAAPSELLGQLLRGLGVPTAEVPLAVAEQVALFRSITAGKAVAVLLDDAASTAQVRTLLPSSPRSLVVVTSRWRLTGLAVNGAQVIPVDPLDSGASVELLALAVGSDRVADEHDAACELAELCGGMPIALRVVAARLSSRPRRRVTRAVEDLRDEQHRLGALADDDRELSVEASLDLSYRELSPQAARLYRLLSLHPGAMFGPGIVAACVGCSDAYAENLLDELVEASMVADHAEDRYRVHDLLRLHAQRHAKHEDSETDRAGAVQAMVLWYLDHAVAADLVVTPLRTHYGDRYRRAEQPQRFHTASDGLDWLEQELPNLTTAARVAFERGWHELMWQLCEAMWGLFLHRSHYPEWIEIHELGVQSAAVLGDPIIESRMLVQLAAAYLRLGQHDTAARWGVPALERAEAAGHWASEATARETLGAVAHGQGRLEDALGHYRRALSLSEEHGQTRGGVLLSTYLGYLLRDLNRFPEAVEHFHRARGLAASIGDLTSQAQALVGLGSTQARQGQFCDAIAGLTEALSLLDYAAAPALHVDVLHQLGEISRQAGDLVAAGTHWEQAIRLYTSLGDPKADQVRALLDALGGPPSDDVDQASHT